MSNDQRTIFRCANVRTGCDRGAKRYRNATRCSHSRSAFSLAEWASRGVPQFDRVLAFGDHNPLITVAVELIAADDFNWMLAIRRITPNLRVAAAHTIRQFSIVTSLFLLPTLKNSFCALYGLAMINRSASIVSWIDIIVRRYKPLLTNRSRRPSISAVIKHAKTRGTPSPVRSDAACPHAPTTAGGTRRRHCFGPGWRWRNGRRQNHRTRTKIGRAGISDNYGLQPPIEHGVSITGMRTDAHDEHRRNPHIIIS